MAVQTLNQRKKLSKLPKGKKTKEKKKKERPNLTGTNKVTRKEAEQRNEQTQPLKSHQSQQH